MLWSPPRAPLAGALANLSRQLWTIGQGNCGRQETDRQPRTWVAFEDAGRALVPPPVAGRVDRTPAAKPIHERPKHLTVGAQHRLSCLGCFQQPEEPINIAVGPEFHDGLSVKPVRGDQWGDRLTTAKCGAGQESSGRKGAQ